MTTTRYATTLLDLHGRWWIDAESGRPTGDNLQRIIGVSRGNRVLGYRVKGGFWGQGGEANRCALTIAAAHYIAGWDCGLWTDKERRMLG